LLETTHIDNARRQNLAGANADDAIDRQKNATAARDFHGESNDNWRPLGPVGHDNIAYATDPIAERVKDRTPRESGDIYACRTHVSSVLAG
jgi:hypothetical protein